MSALERDNNNEAVAPAPAVPTSSRTIAAAADAGASANKTALNKRRSALLNSRKRREKSWLSPYLYYSLPAGSRIVPKQLRKLPSAKSFLAAVAESTTRATPSVRPNRSDIASVRTPWVPAPARSTISFSGGGGDSFQFGNQQHTSFIAFEPPLFSDIKSPRPDQRQQQQQSHNIKASRRSSSASITKGDKSKKGGQLMSSTKGNRGKARPVSAKGSTVRHSSSVANVVGATTSGTIRKPGSSGFTTLKSKDSLIDVTACIQDKRKEVMKLWQNTLVKDDPILLAKIETVNKLAIETAEEVETLRMAIQELQRNLNDLTEEDFQKLNDLRERVLSKVQEFEKEEKSLQKEIVEAKKRSSSKTSLVSGGAFTQTDQNNSQQQQNLLDKHSLNDIIFLKEKSNPFHPASNFALNHEQTPSNFSSEAESKTDQENDVLLSEIQPPQFPLYSQSEKSSLHSEKASVENLHKLKALFDEGLRFPPMIPEEGTRLSRSQSYQSGLDEKSDRDQKPRRSNQYPQHVRFVDKSGQKHVRHRTRTYSANPSSHSESGRESLFTEEAALPSTAEELYRKKVSHLQRKLMNTETEVEELKSNIERIESDANFRVRLLQNTLQDKFDSLSMLPDYMQMVDVKLTETVHSKAQLERELAEKEKLLSEEKELTRALRKEAEELKEKLRSAESFKELQTYKVEALEKSNALLRKELQDGHKARNDLAKEIRTMKEREAIHFGGYSPRSPRLTRATCVENERLKMKCSELKDELSQSKRIIQTLKQSKSKLASDLNVRVEELLTLLQVTQEHKRILGEQIRYLKKSYNELFPCRCETKCSGSSNTTFQQKLDTMSELVMNSNAASASQLPQPRQSSTSNRASSNQRKSKRSKSVSSKSTESTVKMKPVHEPLVKSQVAWVAGKGCGEIEFSSIDNLLNNDGHQLNYSSRQNLSLEDVGFEAHGYQAKLLANYEDE